MTTDNLLYTNYVMIFLICYSIDSYGKLTPTNAAFSQQKG